MGNRKHKMAIRMKDERKRTYIARLNDCPSSPRKMRLVADLVRGMDVAKASAVLQFTKKHAARELEKLLRSAISNFEQKTGERWEDADLIIKEISVDGGRVLKRISPAPQGRAYRIRKRSNHVTMVLDSTNPNFVANTNQVESTESQA